jgi:hypothetical protein
MGALLVLVLACDAANGRGDRGGGRHAHAVQLQAHHGPR